MSDSEIPAQVVRTMWNDNLLEGSKCAEVGTVADYAVQSSDEGKAKALIENQMITDDECPVTWVIAGEAITLQKDREAVARYILKHGSEDVLPWDLKDVIQKEKATSELTDVSR